MGSRLRTILESLVSLAIRDYFSLPCFAHSLKPCGKWKKNISISEGTLLVQISCKSARKVCTITKTRPKTKTRGKKKARFPGIGKRKKGQQDTGSNTATKRRQCLKSSSSVQFSCSVTSLRPHDCSTPGLPVHHQLPEFTQTHVHRVGDAIQPSHPLSSPSPPAPNPSQHQSLFQWVNSSHEVAKVLEFQL